MEILVVDGDSDDGTRDLVLRLAMRDPRIRLLDNPRRHVAPGLNVGLAAARGEIVARVDGHCEIPPDYLAVGVEMLRAGVADCAGGPVRAVGETAVARAIALAMSTPFGVGGASFRWAGTCRDVDHLPFGVWRRLVFDVIGPFDESLVRNQDDELSDRLRRAGGRIRMNPAITVRYFSRTSFARLWRQYHGYGFWKVRVIRKRGGRPSSLRHLVPAAFVLASATSAVVAAIARSWLLPAVVLIPYAVFLGVTALHLAVTRGRPGALLAPVAVATMHLAYGIGFLRALTGFGAGAPPAAAERERRAA